MKMMNNIQKVRPTMKKINRSRISDQIINQILSLISEGKLRIGDKLPPESVLVKQFGVGRSSLREAIRALSLVEVINVRHGQGMYIAASPESLPTYSLRWNNLRGHDKVEQIIEARILLEQIIAQCAIEKASDEDIAEIRSKLRHIQSAKNDRNDYIQADMAFHFAIAKASHNPILVRFFSDIRQMIRTWIERRTPFSDQSDKYIISEQHNEILEAIQERDIKKAHLAIRKHLEKGINA